MILQKKSLKVFKGIILIVKYCSFIYTLRSLDWLLSEFVTFLDPSKNLFVVEILLVQIPCPILTCKILGLVIITENEVIGRY